jgi:hypothetical protein
MIGRTKRMAAMPLLIFAVSIGCSRSDRLEVAPVRGRVEYQGQGVPNATVIFHPQNDVSEKAQKMRPFAYADGDGNFQLKTYVDNDGAPLGTYRVSIIAGAGKTEDERGAAPPEAGQAPAPPARGPRVPPEIAQKYRNVDTAGIQVTVKEGENILEPFAL